MRQDAAENTPVIRGDLESQLHKRDIQHFLLAESFSGSASGRPPRSEAVFFLPHLPPFDPCSPLLRERIGSVYSPAPMVHLASFQTHTIIDFSLVLFAVKFAHLLLVLGEVSLHVLLKFELVKVPLAVKPATDRLVHRLFAVLLQFFVGM